MVARIGGALTNAIAWSLAYVIAALEGLLDLLLGTWSLVDG